MSDISALIRQSELVHSFQIRLLYPQRQVELLSCTANLFYSLIRVKECEPTGANVLTVYFRRISIIKVVISAANKPMMRRPASTCYHLAEETTSLTSSYSILGRNRSGVEMRGRAVVSRPQPWLVRRTERHHNYDVSNGS